MKSKRSAHSISKVIAHVGLAVAVSACSTLYSDQPGPQVSVPDLNDPVQRSASLLRYCIKLHQQGDLNLAAGICNRAHEIDPTNPAPLMELASVFQDLGMANSAAEAYRAALLLNPQEVDALYGLGRLYIDRQRYDLAMEPLETAVLLEIEDPRIYNALGVIMDQQDDHALAQSYYRQGLAYSPRNISLRNNLGLSLVLNGQDGEGLAMLREVAAEPDAGATAGRNLELATEIAAQSRDAAPIASNLPPTRSADGAPDQRRPLSASPARPAYLSSMSPAATIHPQAAPVPEAADDRPTGTPVSLLQRYERSTDSLPADTATDTREDHLADYESAAAYTPPLPHGSFAMAQSRTLQVDATAEAKPQSGPAAEQPAAIATDHDLPITAPQQTRPAEPEVAEITEAAPDVTETIEETAPRNAPVPQIKYQLAEIEALRARRTTVPDTRDRRATIAAKPAAEQPAAIATDHDQPITAPQRTRPAEPEMAEMAEAEPLAAEMAEAAPDVTETIEETAPRNAPVPQTKYQLAEIEALRARRTTVPDTKDHHATNGYATNGHETNGHAINGVAVHHADADLSLQVAGASPASAPEAESSGTPPVIADEDSFYTVQLGSFRSAERARLGWSAVSDTAGETLAELDALIVRANLGIEKGIVYRVRTAPMESQSVAAQLCERLTDKGIDCMVVKASRKATAEGLVDKICQDGSTTSFCQRPQHSKAEFRHHAS